MSMVGAGIAMLVIVRIVLSYYEADLPPVTAFTNYAPPQLTRVLDRNGRLLHEAFQERRTVVPMDQVPRHLVLAVLAAEDADFYRHSGLDYAGIMRAMFRDLTSGRAMQGASTITQQIVKNVLLSPERTLTRKFKELILARRIEQDIEDKDQILHVYLNHIYFGHGRYGVQEAARYFFGKDVSELNLAESSLIAGLPQSPNRLSPINHPEAAKQRQRYVLGQLLAKRKQYWPDLTAEEIEAALNTEVELADHSGVESGAPEVVASAQSELKGALQRYAKNHVPADAQDDAVRSAIKTGGFTIQTTLDMDLQQLARQALLDGLKELDARQGLVGPLKVPRGRRARKPLPQYKSLRSGRTYDVVVTGTDDDKGLIELDIGGHRAIAKLKEVSRFNPKGLSASQFAPRGARARAMVDRVGSGDTPSTARLALGPQGAVIAIEPRTREVLALVGGDVASYGFNRATQAIRQPGSSFKPLVYAVALNTRRYTPATLVLDAPEVFDEWKPDNFQDQHYAGDVRLREGLARSINLVAVRVIKDITPQAVVDFARGIGISTELDPSLALSLGASGVRPIELVNGYATFAAGGTYADYQVVKDIKASRRTVDSMLAVGNRQQPSERTAASAAGSHIPMPLEPHAGPRQVLDKGVAYLVTSMLQSVVQRGTAQRAHRALSGRPAAGKTGTSNQARDAWFVGYTQELVVGVWVGYDDHRPLGRGEGGSSSALPIWIDIINGYLKDQPAKDFIPPPSIEQARIDPATGKLAYAHQTDAIVEMFLEGTVPADVASPPDVVDSSHFLMGIP